MQTKRYYVYILSDNGTPFYVGKGSGCRVYNHKNEARRGHHCHKCNKIRKLWREGREYTEQIVFETNDEQDALDKEVALIAEIGFDNLCNLTTGGEGATKPEHIKQEQIREGMLIGVAMKSELKAFKQASVSIPEFYFRKKLAEIDRALKEERRRARQAKKFG